MVAKRAPLGCALLAFTLAILPEAAAGQGATASSPPEFARRAEHLKPGEWVWAPQIAPTGPILIYVDLSKQIATVYRNGIRIAVSTISSGKDGYETPTGIFTILQKDADHRSNLYGGGKGAPMPFQQRLTWDGVALHAGGLPGYPESHGCVHLPYEFSKQLFSITKIGATVVVQGDAIDHVRTSSADLLVPIDAKGNFVPVADIDDGEFRWTPEKSPSGPMTIIIAKTDQRIVVLRNGVEIGRSVARIDDPDPGSHVITLTTGKDGKPRWIYVGLPGHADDDGRALDEATINRVRLPRTFWSEVRSAAVPGTTVLVTASSVGASEGKRITIMDAVPPTP